MKKKILLIAGIVCFVSAILLLILIPRCNRVVTPTDKTESLADVIKVVRPKIYDDDFADMINPHDKDGKLDHKAMLAYHTRRLTTINQELKDPNITPEIKNKLEFLKASAEAGIAEEQIKIEEEKTN